MPDGYGLSSSDRNCAGGGEDRSTYGHNDDSAVLRRYVKDRWSRSLCVPAESASGLLRGCYQKTRPVDYDPRLRLTDYLGLAGGPLPGADLSRVVSLPPGTGPDVTRAVVTLSVVRPASGLRRRTLSSDPATRYGSARR